jgi:hypothetical protein
MHFQIKYIPMASATKESTDIRIMAQTARPASTLLSSTHVSETGSVQVYVEIPQQRLAQFPERVHAVPSQ